jgi:AcrR family transcriptional regulator
VSTRLTSEERREHLLHVGVQLVGRYGTADVSIEEVAREAGVSKGLLYHYFPTKNDFFLAVLARSQAELDEQFSRDRELSAVEQFDQNLDGFLRFVDDHAAGYVAVANARGREPRVQKMVEQRRGRRVEELVALAALLAGLPREEARTPLLVAGIEGWLGYSEAVILRWLSDRELTRDEVHALLHAVLLQVFESASVQVSAG